MLLSGRLNPGTTFFFFSVFLSRCTTCCHSSKADVISVQSRAWVSSLSPSPAGPREIMACCIAVSGVIRLCGTAAPSLWCSCPLQGGWGPIAYTGYSDGAGGDWQQHAPVWDGRASPLLRCYSSGLQRRAAHTQTHTAIMLNDDLPGSKSIDIKNNKVASWWIHTELKQWAFITMLLSVFPGDMLYKCQFHIFRFHFNLSFSHFVTCF